MYDLERARYSGQVGEVIDRDNPPAGGDWKRTYTSTPDNILWVVFDDGHELPAFIDELTFLGEGEV